MKRKPYQTSYTENPFKFSLPAQTFFQHSPNNSNPVWAEKQPNMVILAGQRREGGVIHHIDNCLHMMDGQTMA